MPANMYDFNDRSCYINAFRHHIHQSLPEATQERVALGFKLLTDSSQLPFKLSLITIIDIRSKSSLKFLKVHVFLREAETAGGLRGDEHV
jgi:hypothetical protein